MSPLRTPSRASSARSRPNVLPAPRRDSWSAPLQDRRCCQNIPRAPVGLRRGEAIIGGGAPVGKGDPRGGGGKGRGRWRGGGRGEAGGGGGGWGGGGGGGGGEKLRELPGA